LGVADEATGAACEVVGSVATAGPDDDGDDGGSGAGEPQANDAVMKAATWRQRMSRQRNANARACRPHRANLARDSCDNCDARSPGRHGQFIPIPALSIVMAWHRRAHLDPGQAWIRRQLLDHVTRDRLPRDAR